MNGAARAAVQTGGRKRTKITPSVPPAATEGEKRVTSMKFFPRLEAHRLTRWNADLLTGSGIPANPGFARPNIKHAKSAQLDAITFRQGFFHGLKHCFNRGLSLGFGNSCAFYHLIDNVVFNHAYLLKIQQVSS